MKRLALVLALVASVVLLTAGSANAQRGRASDGTVSMACTVVPLNNIHPACSIWAYRWNGSYWTIYWSGTANLGSPNQRYAQMYSITGYYYFYAQWYYNGHTYGGSTGSIHFGLGGIANINLYY